MYVRGNPTVERTSSISTPSSVEQHWQAVTRGQVTGVSDETWARADASVGSSIVIPAGASTVNHECVWESCAVAVQGFFGDTAMVASMMAVSRPSLSLWAGCGSLRQALSTLPGSPAPGYTAQFVQCSRGRSSRDLLCAFQAGRLCACGAYVAVPVGRDGNRSHAVAVVVKPGNLQILDINGCPTTMDLACGGQCTGLHIVQVLDQQSAADVKMHNKQVQDNNWI